MLPRVLIPLGAALIVAGISLLQFAWWFEWHCGFEYAHEVGCILLYAGVALLLAVLAHALLNVAVALQGLWQVIALRPLR